jgi:CDP-glucose 4,6-dehydratase
MVEKILGLMGASVEFDMQNDASNEILNQFLSAERARTELGWRSLFTVDEGLKRTIAWYRDFAIVHARGEKAQ